jgi:hypothetical protein
LPTPTESPVLKKSVLPQLLGYDQMHTQTCLASVTGDPSMPAQREIKRFVRKCPKLNLFEWYGKHGRGSWTVTRPISNTSKTSINISVDYHPPSITQDVWKAMLRDNRETETQRNERFSTIERAGQTWTGPTADAMAAERVAENEKEEGASISCNEKERHGKLRESRRKARVLSVSTSNSGDNAQLPTPTGSSYSPSPSLKYPPVSPHQSETSVSTVLSSVSSELNSSPPKTSTHWRARSSSGAVTKEKGERQDYFSKSTNTTSGGGSGGSKPGRRRGVSTGAARGGYKKRGLGSDGDPSGSQGTESPRRGRGGARGSGHLFGSGTSGGSHARKAPFRRSSD